MNRPQEMHKRLGRNLDPTTRTEKHLEQKNLNKSGNANSAKAPISKIGSRGKTKPVVTSASERFEDTTRKQQKEIPSEFIMKPNLTSDENSKQCVYCKVKEDELAFTKDLLSQTTTDYVAMKRNHDELHTKFTKQSIEVETLSNNLRGEKHMSNQNKINFENRLSETKVQLELKQAALDHLKSELSSRILTYQVLEEHASRHNISLKNAEARAEAAETLSQSLQLDLENCKASLHRLEVFQSGLSSENERLRASCLEAENHLRDVKQKLAFNSAREEQLNSTKKYITAASTAHQVENESLKAELDLANQTIRSLQKFQQEHSERKLHNDEVNADLQQQLQNTMRALEDEKRRCEEAERKNDKLEAEASMLRAKMQYATSKITEQEEALQKAHEMESSLQAKVEETEKQLNIQNDLENLNIDEFQKIMEQNMKIGAEFNKFLSRHAIK